MPETCLPAILGCVSRRVACANNRAKTEQHHVITDSTDLTNFTDRSATETPPIATSRDDLCSTTSGYFKPLNTANEPMGVLLSKNSSRLVGHGTLSSEERSVEFAKSVESVTPLVLLLAASENRRPQIWL
jgi:hypothetical protein